MVYDIIHELLAIIKSHVSKYDITLFQSDNNIYRTALRMNICYKGVAVPILINICILQYYTYMPGDIQVSCYNTYDVKYNICHPDCIKLILDAIDYIIEIYEPTCPNCGRSVLKLECQC